MLTEISADADHAAGVTDKNERDETKERVSLDRGLMYVKVVNIFKKETLI